MSVRVSCPFCNAAFILTDVPPSRRTPCPRCGETVAVKPADGSDFQPAILPFPKASVNGEADHHVPPPPPVVRPLLPLAWIGWVMLLLILGVGLAAIFLRPNQPAPPTAVEKPKPPTTWPPTAVPGLAYLPADVNVVAAVQPRAIYQYAERTKTDPKELLAAAGVPEAVRASLDKLGVPPDRIAHAVAGVAVAGNNVLPPVVVVLTVTMPYDETALLKAAKATRDPDAPGRFKADLGGLPVLMAEATDGVFVFATRATDLDGLPAKAGKGSGHLQADVRESLEKLSPASVAWAATGSANWAEKPELKLWSNLLKRPDLPDRLAGVKAAAVGVSLEPDPKLTLAVRADTADQGELRKRVQDAFDKATITDAGQWLTAEKTLERPPAGK